MVLLAPIHLEEGRKLEDKLKVLLQQGFARVLVDNEMVRLDELEQHKLDNKDILLIIDRIVVKRRRRIFKPISRCRSNCFLRRKRRLFFARSFNRKTNWIQH
jgi:excinuclease ABC subunit A